MAGLIINIIYLGGWGINIILHYCVGGLKYNYIHHKGGVNGYLSEDQVRTSPAIKLQGYSVLNDH